MRYVTRPRASDWPEDRPHIEGKTVHEREPVDTGLLDKDGTPIYRVMSPIGFIELRERPKILAPKTGPGHFTPGEIKRSIRKVLGE